MPQYKVKFKVDLIFPKSRITRKIGSTTFQANEILEVVKFNSEELIPVLSANIEKIYKTGKVFGLDITSIEYYPKK